MIWIAIAIQLMLSVGLLWTTWQVWMVRKALQETVITVDGWTDICRNGLNVSSPSIEVARDGVGDIKKQYQSLQVQLERIRKLLSVLVRGVSFLGSRWQQSRHEGANPLSNKSINKPTNKNSNKLSRLRSAGSKNNVKRRR
jgi:hypothetical protein